MIIDGWTLFLGGFLFGLIIGWALEYEWLRPLRDKKVTR